MRNKLNQTMRFRVTEEMMAALVRIAEVKSQERGCYVGYSTIVREALIEHIREQESRGVSPTGA